MEVVVIGAGPAGMIAAIEALRLGSHVSLIDTNNKPGRKIYSTGNGRCNYSNELMSPEYFNDSSSKFVENALQVFDNNKLKEYLETLGLFTRNINGYYYPNSEQASSVAEVLVNELTRLKCNIVTEDRVLDVIKSKNGFMVISNNNSFVCDRVIIAVGGLAAPSLGSDGNLFECIKRLGHSFTDMYPALVGLTTAGKKLESLSGVRTRAKVSLYNGEEFLASDTGEIIFNKNYVGGIPVMQLSSKYAGNFSKKSYLLIDLLNEYSEDELFVELSKRLFSNYSSGKTIYQALTGMLNSKLLDYCLKTASINPDKKASVIKPSEINKLIEALKYMRVEISGNLGFDKAQVTKGGVKLSEIKSNMESKLVKGLYFAGEVLDVDGLCGGYNLQWAFTSGYIAGRAK
ncbi:MAG: aminoacetone oxidase family FAD-binding enzyme [Clostridiales bacterium]|nr:aminoacetone oxidase family FAD-binding enzyme [Clostridiales bacterium]